MLAIIAYNDTRFLHNSIKLIMRVILIKRFIRIIVIRSINDVQIIFRVSLVLSNVILA
jgi:hypothetical protein